MIYLLNGGVIWSLPTPDTKWNKIVNYFLINQIIAGKKGDHKSLGFFPKSLGFSLSPPKHESKRHVLVTKLLPRCGWAGCLFFISILLVRKVYYSVIVSLLF